ncbi:unnamed protein product [Rotaria magnacalcarata]
MSSKNYSTYTENLFNRFEKYLKHNYEHLWKKINRNILISTQPEQMEFDILGFSFEHSSKERTLIESPNLQAISARSSYNYLKPFHANTVIIAEVTTSFLSFHNDDLSLCEKKKISSSLINIERKKSSFKLFQKLLQLERGLAFILLYYGIQLEYVLVVLFGRWIRWCPTCNPGRLFFPQAIQLTHIQITLNEFCDCASSLDQASSQLCSFTIRIVYVYVGNINTIFQIASISCPYLKQLTMKIY